MKTEDDIVELRGGKGAVLRATQRQNDLDSRLVNISRLNKSYNSVLHLTCPRPPET